MFKVDITRVRGTKVLVDTHIFHNDKDFDRYTQHIAKFWSIGIDNKQPFDGTAYSTFALPNKSMCGELGPIVEFGLTKVLSPYEKEQDEAKTAS